MRSQLYVAFDVGYISQSEFEHVFSMAEEVTKIIGGLRASVSKQRANDVSLIFISVLSPQSLAL